MELRRYLAILSAYKWPLLMTPILAGLVGFLVTYALSPRYVSTSTVQIIPEQTEPRSLIFRGGNGLSVLATGIRDPGELLAQGIMESLASREVATIVVHDLGLDAAAPLPQGLEALKSWVSSTLGDIWTFLRFGYVVHQDRTESAIQSVQSALSASLVRGSYYLKISATTRDPQTAAALANAAIQAYLRHSRQIVSTAAADDEQFLSARVEAARADMESVRQKVLDYSRSVDVLAGDSLRQAVIALDLSRASLRDMRAATLAATQSLAAAEQQLAATSAEATTTQSIDGPPQAAPAVVTTSTRSPNPLYQGLQDRVNTLRQEAAAVRARLDQPEALLRAQDRQALDEAERRLSTAEQQLASTPAQIDSVQTGEVTAPPAPTATAPSTTSSTTRTSSLNPVYQGLQDRVNALRQEVAAVQARQNLPEAQLRASDRLAVEEAQRRVAEAEQQLRSTPAEVETIQSTQTAAAPPGPQTSVTRTSAPNPVHQSLQERVNSLNQDVAALQTRQQQAEEQVQAREKDLHAVMASDTRLAALNQELAVATDTFNQRSKDWQLAKLEVARPISQVRVIDRAVAPAYPAFPVKILFAGIGAAAGLLLAVALVFVRHSMDLSLRSVAEAEAALDLRLLAVVPTSRNGHHRPAARRRESVH